MFILKQPAPGNQELISFHLFAYKRAFCFNFTVFEIISKSLPNKFMNFLSVCIKLSFQNILFILSLMIFFLQFITMTINAI